MNPRARLVCLPCAGGSADAYRPWSPWLPEDCELLAPDLPGHGRRLPEPPLETAAEVVADLLPRLGDPAVPLVLFGHSMGGLLAYELCRALCARGTPPRALVVSAIGPPETLPGDRELADDPEALLAHVVRLGATPPQVLASPEMRALVLRPLQADFRLLAAAAHTPARTVAVPLYALAGDRDPVHPPHEVVRWERHAPRWQGLRGLPGDHFFPWQGDEVPRLLAGLTRTAAGLGADRDAADAHQVYAP